LDGKKIKKKRKPDIAYPNTDKVKKKLRAGISEGTGGDILTHS